MEDNCNSTVERQDLIDKSKYVYNAKLDVMQNKYRPTIQYGLFPQASDKIKGVSE